MGAHYSSRVLLDCSTDRSWRRASIQRVVPREETLSQFDSKLLFDCHRPNLQLAICVSPICWTLNLRVTNLLDTSSNLCVWLKVGDDQGSSLGLRFAVSWDLVFDTEAPPRERGGAWGFVFAQLRCAEAGPGAERLRAVGHATPRWRPDSIRGRG